MTFEEGEIELVINVPVDPHADCPHADGPFHFWTCDGPFTVQCESCGADGRITVTEEGTA